MSSSKNSSQTITLRKILKKSVIKDSLSADEELHSTHKVSSAI